MSIMKTIMFPGDTEPREIQDSRIEIITIKNDGTPSMTYDEACAFIYDNTEDATLYIANNGTGGPLVYSQMLTDNCDEFGHEGLGFSSITPYQSEFYNTTLPMIVNTVAFLTPDNTIEFDEVEYLAVPAPWNQEQGAPNKCVLTMHFNESDSSLFYGWDAPIADANLAGMVKAIPATSEMTEYIGIDNNGQLRVAPSNDIETDETLSLAGYAADAQVVGNKLSSIPISIAEDGYTEINGLRQAVQIDIAKNSETNITVLTTLESAVDDVVQTTSIIELDVNGFPVKITTNEVECVINWEGF